MSAEPHNDIDDPDTDINPFTMLFPPQPHEDLNNAAATPSLLQEQEQHFLSSINSILIIRQLPSQGLSFQLWPAATTLVNLLDGRHSSNPLFNKSQENRCPRILELGSGTGLVGLAAAAILGAHVTVTDLPHVLPNLQFNIEVNAGVLEVNGGRVNARALSWGEIDQMEVIGRQYDYILASDVVYDDNLYEPLLKTLGWFLKEKKGMVFVMAHLKRWKKELGFFKKAKKMFDVEIIHADDPSPGSRIGVVVYTFVAKPKKVVVVVGMKVKSR